MKSILLIIFSGFYITVFGQVECPNCVFENQEGDRYCVECGEVMEMLSEEERERLEKINEKRRAAVIEAVARDKRPCRRVGRGILDLTYSYKVTRLMPTHIKILIVVENLTPVKIEALSVLVEAEYNKVWKASGAFPLIEHFDDPIEACGIHSKEITLFGVTSPVPWEEKYIDVSIKTVSWTL